MERGCSETSGKGDQMIILFALMLLLLGVFLSVLKVVFRLTGCIIWCGLLLITVGGATLLGIGGVVFLLSIII